MIECYKTVKTAAPVTLRVSLNFEQRQKSRGRATTDSGEDVAWFLARAHILADGDCLQAEDGNIVQVIAAPETLSEVQCEDTLLLTKAAYHLGNRHVPLQITGSTLSYQHDHVLDAMVEGLGLQVCCVNKPFHPEPGAYHTHGNGHSHSHHSHEQPL